MINRILSRGIIPITFSKGIFHNRSIKAILNYKLQYKPCISSTKAMVVGWGEKSNTIEAKAYAKKRKIPYVHLEDGFIRSVGLGVDNAPSFSIVVDKLGIYYDATKPSSLEKMLQSRNLSRNTKLMAEAKLAIELIKQFEISKYNMIPLSKAEILPKNGRKKVLFIAQTKGDYSLTCGYGETFSTEEIFNTVIAENPNSDIYVKIHPDVLTGKKESDIDLEKIKERKEIAIISEPLNSISLLKEIDKVYTKTSQMGFEALILGKEVVCLGVPFYSGWGLTDDRVACPRRTRTRTLEEVFAAAYILYSYYYNPYTERKTDIIDVLYTLNKQRQISYNNSGKNFFFNFENWKHSFIRNMFKSFLDNKILFCQQLEDALEEGMDQNSKIYIWGKKAYPELSRFSQENNIPIYRIEDGFYRSLTLGCYRSKPCSVLIDEKDVHYDPRKVTEIETLLSEYNFQNHPKLLSRANAVINFVANYGISKYNIQKIKKLKVNKGNCDKIILIPGQVSSDQAIHYGGMGMTNRKLVMQVREENPNSYIIYKPHPDVLSHLREGYLSDNFLHKYCNLVVGNLCLDSCIQAADEVHVISSMCGLEALIRGKKVITYGLPFYAGWGLTEDKLTIPRRKRKLTLLELTAGSVILYPRYIHPKTNQICEIEAFLAEIYRERKRYFGSIFYRIRIDSKKYWMLCLLFFEIVYKFEFKKLLNYYLEVFKIKT